MKTKMLLIASSFLVLFLTVGCPAQTITPNIGLQIPAYGSTNWTVPLNYNFNLLDGILGGTSPVPGMTATGTVKSSILNATTGFQLNGSYGDSGQCFISTGTGTRFGDCGSGGGMVYPGSGVPNSTGAGWGSSYAVGTGANDLLRLDSDGIANAAGFKTNSGSAGINVTGQSGCAQFDVSGNLGSTGSPCAESDNLQVDTITFGSGGPVLRASPTSPGAGTFNMPNLPSGGIGILSSFSVKVTSYSASAAFDPKISLNQMVLTGNLSFTLGSANGGQTTTLCFEQGSGSYTVTPPSNVHGFFTIGTNSGKWNCQQFVFDNTDLIWLALSPGVINE